MLRVLVRFVIMRFRSIIEKALVVRARWCDTASLPSLDYPIRVQPKELMFGVLFPNKLVEVATEAFPKSLGVGNP